jgi:ABC-2 type transport system ATP-binding protein
LEFAAQPDDESLNRLIRSLDGAQDVRREKDFYLIDSTQDLRTDLAKAALEDGYALCLVRERGGDLDDIYRSYFARRE